MRLRPSERTRKLALPKLRMLMMRPAVIVSVFDSSSASLDRPLCASTSAEMVSVTAKRCGYAWTPSLRDGVEVGPPLLLLVLFVGHLLDHLALVAKALEDAVQDAVDETGGIVATVQSRELDGFIDHHAGRRARFTE